MRKFEGFFKQFIIEYKAKSGNSYAVEFEGCSQDEMDSLNELVAPNTLPAAYIAFLKCMGRKAPAITANVDSHYSRIIELQEYVPELLEEDGCGDFLIGNRFVVASHEGFIYYIIPLNAGDNPPVYDHNEGGKPEKYTYSFTDFLLRESGLWAKREKLMSLLNSD